MVSDQSGAVLPGANVTLSNVNTGINTMKQSDTVSLYVFDYVNPGAYQLMVEGSGFGRFTQQSIVVQSGGGITVNANLTPSAI